MAAGEFKLKGFKSPAPAEAGLRSKRIGVRAEFRVGAARGPADTPSVVPVADRDIVELEFRDGLRLWLRGDEYRARAGRTAQRGGAGEADVVEVPARWESPGEPGAERGFGGFVLKALRVLGVDPAQATAREIAETFEKGRANDPKRPGPGFYRVRLATGDFRLEPGPAARDIPTDKPVLVLIHGTASSTWGSFGELWSAARRDTLARLRGRYGDNVFAFEHRSFTASVIENALELAGRLPAGARVDLLSHSRGGLVGELLCRGTVPAGEAPFAEDEIELAGRLRDLDGRRLSAGERERIDASLAAAKDQLRQLGARLAASEGIKVERFVRVACPALGTTLVSNRLDRWLSVIANVGALALPASPIADIAEALGDFIAAVIDEKTDPATLPGLAFFLPDAGLMRVVNNRRRTLDSRLYAIAGDIVPEGIWHRLLNLVLDRFYDGEHDLVVNTVSMRGGTPRSDGKALLSYHQGPTVNHFTYFSNAGSAEAIAAALVLPETVRLPGFEPLRAPERDIPRGAALRAPTGPAPRVFVLPGIMGSELRIGAREIWVDVPALAAGGLAELKIDAANVEAWQPYPGYYGALIDHLGRTHQVIPFPFDWRLPPEREAERLADALEKAIEAAAAENQPVRLLAHSMGGLVVRAMIAKRPAVWEKLKRHPNARFVMLGTPNGGSHAITELIVGRSETFGMLALLDFADSARELLEIVVRFPGVLAMLPNHGRENWLDADAWERFARVAPSGWVVPARRDLEAAARFRTLINASPIEPERMVYVAGKARATPTDMVIGVSDFGANEVQFEATRRGDGRVTWDSGIPAGLAPYYMPVEHGDLSAATEHFPAIAELLDTGATARLSQTPPVERADDRPFVLQRPAAESLPDERSLAAAALGAAPAVRRSRREQAIPLRVSVLHGDLAHAPHPVLVGHYAGDTIVSAERALDRALGGRLAALHRVGLYPGPLETCQLVLRVGEANRGAVVVGLGPAGELNTGQLKRTVAHAALTYAMEAAEQAAAAAPGAPPQEIALASLLIGTQAGGVRIVDATLAILDGCARANEALAAAEQPVRIARVVLVELFEDRALAAIDALRALAGESVLRGRFVYEPRIVPGRGRRTRQQFEEPPGWWQRMQVRGCRPDGRPDSALTFLALTRRARAEARVVEGQRRLVDALVARAIASADYDRGLGQTLFDLLVPNALKEQAPDEDRLMLVLDAESARYPWELLEDPLDPSGRPLAIGRGLIRQLETKGFRGEVRGSERNIALVVGDPLLTDAGRKKYPRLDGAKAEAAAVARRLAQAGFDVEEHIRAASGEITQALYAWPYRIVHIAAHGVYREPLDRAAEDCDRCGQRLAPDAGAPQTATGVVIGDDVFLTPSEIEQMRRVPEVVFVNCCHLGFVEATPVNAIAANVATQFIGMGVRCVVAAGWAVNDKAAETFATAFYDALLGGATFGDAVAAARLATWERHRDTNTWGAYQCYGDPDFRLRVAEEPPRAVQFATAQQAVGEIERVEAAIGRRGAAEDVQDLVERLGRIEQETGPFGGVSNGGIALALARAYAEAGEFGRAIELYRAALAAESGEMRIRDMEQLANLESRDAARGFAAADAAGQARRLEANDASIRRLRWLAGASEALDAKPHAAPGATAERLALIGGAYKRKAEMSTGDAARKALDTAGEWYRLAAEVAQRAFAEAGAAGRTVRLNAYPLTAWVGAELAATWARGARAVPRKKREDLDRALAGAAAALAECRAPVETLWDQVYALDVELLRALSGEALTDPLRADLERRYAEVLAQATPRERDSVIGQIRRLGGAASKAQSGGRRGAPESAAQLAMLATRLEAKGG